MLIEARNLSKIYKTKLSLVKSKNETIKAVNDVSFSIDSNQIVGLVGESGCGKSTLSRLLIRLEKPTEGVIKFNGEDIWKYNRGSLKEFRKKSQIIFQDTLTSLNPNMKILDSLMEPLDNHFNISRREKLIKIDDIISFVNLEEELLYKYPGALSGGERQRINICRALLLNPQFLICDEIISSLDVCTQACILNLIKKLNDLEGTGILFISHDISAVKYICSKILVMYRGSIVEVMDNTNENYKIKHPYTKSLLNSVPIDNPNKRNII
ncbi:ABC transporter ATP-binding protein [Clostridium ljungdahlii]|uniref:Oligopeptide transport ATP-binding protein OppF n=1 Tax=Clostridium ljungdahlii (strain ATCC 55383 / DSM 13528 / PETC) TaxID=748727 RepID=D8GKI3_CLOLD|nr:ATP-binding cassette domain-containing protein [Clostridium ljungdahlii]ADK15323.1 predicted peptide ABC transporter, ATPase component [Clostridium ljungdahlii DSM 13528]OAA88421.1 Oligopeptide transport ATP-binding protein OppF [Clostridium ljungdahlii DSM 13528]